MSEIFISKLKINKLRKLENISIELSKDIRKHLIITGKNGSGKTTLLLEVKRYLSGKYIGQL
ncbi:MAG TPA: AAA family ATPase, partial [Flavisolibacter sp.]